LGTSLGIPSQIFEQPFGYQGRAVMDPSREKKTANKKVFGLYLEAVFVEKRRQQF
jgi:hypothetical protein